MGIFAELGKIVYVLKNEALVEPIDKLVEVKLYHVPRDVLSLQNAFLNLTTNLDVVVSANSVVNDEEPHPHIFERMDSIATCVESVKFAHEVVEKLGAVPDCFCEMAPEGLQGVVDIEKCRP